MKITMISNAMSHHQKPFCDSLAEMNDVDFHFIATKPLSDERRGMGYSDLNHASEYIIRSYESEDSFSEAKRLSDESDFVIFGSAPYAFIKKRLKGGSWTFIYSERIFKKQSSLYFCVKQWLINLLIFGRYAKKKTKILCASAYAARDFHRFGFQQNQFYKWGYFPRESLEGNDLLKSKKGNSIIWVGRMIAWKHPETAVELALRLKKEKIPFHLTIIGNGELFNSITERIKELELNDCITLTGSMQTDEVRSIMEQSEILVATSDQNEGWGAIINEAMSSACAVCASREMGAAPFLIRDGENGILYHCFDSDTLFERVKELLECPELRQHMARKAQLTIKTEWNANRAAKKLAELCRKLQSGETEYAFPDGICSISEII